jgi:Rrf2 family protein
MRPSIVFSTTFRYALISLLELATATDYTQASIIAKKFNLSSHYLSAVLADLRRLGLIYSHKGNRGGYRLSTSPKLINLLELYRSLAGSPLTPEEEAEASAATSPGADAWMYAFHQRWTNELGSTNLASLQAWIATQTDAGAPSLQ